MPRINLVEKEHAHPTFREIYERQEERGFPVLNIVKLLAHCPEIGNSYQRFAGSILRGENVPAKLRELATLRVGYLAQAEYEFIHHTPLGLRAGLSQKQIDDIGNWPDSPEFDETERTVLRYTDEVARDNAVTDETFAGLKGLFSEHDIVELTLVIGYFVMLCRILVAFQIELEPEFRG